MGANSEEASAGQTKADFIAKLAVLRKECREALFWLRLIAAKQLIEPSELTACRCQNATAGERRRWLSPKEDSDEHLAGVDRTVSVTMIHHRLVGGHYRMSQFVRDDIH